jgi:glycosyltransferase involved in cell wall biosynthesis
MNVPRVLVVTGAYFPEISGGGLQTRALIHALRGSVQFSVLTTTAGPSESTIVDGISVFRVHVTPSSRSSVTLAIARMTWLIAKLRPSFDVLHLQGFSRKNILLTAAARVFKKQILLTLHTGGHDDLPAIKRTSRLGFWSATKAAHIVAVSPGLLEAARQAGVSETISGVIPNGIDIKKFRPIDPSDRNNMRRRLGLPESTRLILCVGFFSHEKGPQRLFQAWAGLPPLVRQQTTLLFVGKTSLPHPEVDPRIVSDIRQHANEIGANPIFVERTLEIEKYYQVADVFVLASNREACPVALLEAMASGLPTIATRLAGCTDAIVVDSVNGLLVEPGNIEDLRGRLLDLLSEVCSTHNLGLNARETISRAYTLEHAAMAYKGLYWQLLAIRGTIP